MITALGGIEDKPVTCGWRELMFLRWQIRYKGRS
jgi:hypothetical protein